MSEADTREDEPGEQRQPSSPSSKSYRTTSSSSTKLSDRPKLISSPSTPRVSPPHMAPITIHANASSIPSNMLPRPPPQAHIAPQHSPDSFDLQHSIGGRAARVPQALSRPGSPALGQGSGSRGAGEAGAVGVSVSDRSGLRDDGVLRRPESVVVHEDQLDEGEAPSSMSAAATATGGTGQHARSGSGATRSVLRPSPLRGGVGLGVLGLDSPNTSAVLRSFSSSSSSPSTVVPHLSPSLELNDALAQAQDDVIPTDELKPHAEVASEGSASSAPSLWDSLFPVPALMPSNKKQQQQQQRSNTMTADGTDGGSDKKDQLRRSQTLDNSAPSSSSSTSLFPSMPAWLTPLSRSPSTSPNPNEENNSNNIAPTEGNASFLDTITRLRSLLGIAEHEAPGDWVRTHRAELDDVVRRAEREEALEMAKRRAEALRIRTGPASAARQFEVDEQGRVVAVDGQDGAPQGKASEGEPEEQILRMQEQWISPTLPVVFCHGLFGFDVLGPRSVPALTINYWRGIIQILQSNGTEVLVTRVPMSASIADRAKSLREQIEAHFEPGQEVNLIGHSMGGLDCRYLVSRLGMGVGAEGGMGVKARSLTTIATPHRGSSFADYLLDDVIGSDRMPFLLGTLDRFGIPGGGAAFENLTQRSMAKFNEAVPDVEGVRYYSWGAAFNPGLFNEFRIPHGIVYAKEGANDGLVSVQSSMWGTYQGTLRGVSHLHLIGWVSAAQNVWRDLVGKRRVFEPGAFYLQICEDLAREGF
ncbi:hypothetical protein A4X06_0g1399 [Tilletia controversa]|uniref:GPI inositol-deacylase n=1 Tax=Tilletia controversa TaxID=13291 RepID=A0A8X7MZV6_9BASI|nr:hypothetical protein CF328_g1233 [Tilletia controversa]KAE8253511.1 hypothetical protein A4X06_0g1399 [Tilletia controversa]